jgi:hypothetical protein
MEYEEEPGAESMAQAHGHCSSQSAEEARPDERVDKDSSKAAAAAAADTPALSADMGDWGQLDPDKMVLLRMETMTPSELKACSLPFLSPV